ncbi:MAG TPA: DUF805 domain-containing protein [Sphingobacteriaceae bacterium]
MNWYLEVLTNYVGFRGRARRKEYWMFTLINFIFSVGAIVMDNALGLAVDGIGYGPVYGIYLLGILVPSIAVCVRRLHDVGKSGWMTLIIFIPIIGAIWLLVLLFTDSMPGTNEYGPNPKDEVVLAIENKI